MIKLSNFSNSTNCSFIKRKAVHNVFRYLIVYWPETHYLRYLSLFAEIHQLQLAQKSVSTRLTLFLVNYPKNSKTSLRSYNFKIFSNKIWPTKAATIGTTNQLINSRIILKPASNEANGPTNPTKPKPAEAGVPETENNATGIAEMIAVNRHGTKIIGFLNKFGIIIFIAPNATAKVTLVVDFPRINYQDNCCCGNTHSGCTSRNTVQLNCHTNGNCRDRRDNQESKGTCNQDWHQNWLQSSKGIN